MTRHVDAEVTMFSPETLAVRWEMSTKTVRRMIWSGKLRHCKIGNLVRVPAAEVQRFERSLAS